MNEIQIINRTLTAAESERIDRGFDELYREESVALESSERFSFVAEAGEEFLGSSSGLAFKNGTHFSGWFQLTDLFVVKEHRSKEIGKALLLATEERMISLGIRNIFLWTSGDKAIRFYARHGYHKFAELENWYSDGSSRVGLRKELAVTS